jgi:autotransporter-associated beta strand protein
MKRGLVLLLFVVCVILVNAQQIAFPGAEGFGKHAVGGRHGSVYRVTNLNDSGAGSFRDAVSQPNRIIVFEVGGVIKINSVLVFKNNQYIAGQTAPGEGITVYGNRVSFSGANNTICRYIRFRMGEKYGDSGKDACGIANGSDMIFDHVSVSWGRDETFSISWDGKGTEPTNITIQNSIISQGLLLHSAGGLIQTNGGVTLYRNLYADNSTRNNKVKGKNQYVNNIVYNWKNGAYIMGGDSEGHSYAHIISNYFIKGPDNGGTPLSGANNLFHVYANDNWYDANKNGLLDGYLVPRSEYSGGPDFQEKPYNYPALPATNENELFENLIPTVGASLPYRDYVDHFVVDEVLSLGTKGALIGSEEELPFGTPDRWLLWGGTKRTDSDNDGIPDDWELANGLNPNLASDAMGIAANGYANIENYINSITTENSQAFLRKPLVVSLKSATPNSITVSWLDYTIGEEGFIIERKTDGAFVETARVTANTTEYIIDGLQPEEPVVLRIKAFNNTIESEYSAELSVKAKPVPVDVLDLKTFVPDIVWSGTVNENWDKTTSNWKSGEASKTFSDSTKVLFGNTMTDHVVYLNETVSPSVIVVDSDNDYTIQGSGSIAGTTSVNKSGRGKLSLLIDNTYTGSTVVHNGSLEINKLANGGQPSSIGASQNYDFNWVWRGGQINYTGPTVSTDRHVALEENTAFGVANSAAAVTFSGIIKGSGGLIKNGEGTLVLTNANPYAGVTTVEKGTLELSGATALESGMGTSNKVVLKGGKLRLWGGSTANYETYRFDIEIEKETVSSFEVFRNCSLENRVYGQGDLHYNINYVREYIKGDWSQFSGTLIANGLGTTSDGNQLMLYNSNGIPNARIHLTGSTKIVCWKNASIMRLGGLSGNSGTMLSGADKQNNGATMTWIVGGAGTDETFNGIINNECSNKNYKGTTSIVKEGTGIWRLNGANIYSGPTTITDGVLIVNGSQTGTGKVTVEGGILAGKGRVSGSVEVLNEAVLSPGDSSIATFSIGGALVLNQESIVEMEINKGLQSNDRVAVSGAVTYNGTLNLLIQGKLEAGDQFTLFTGGSHSGNFSTIVPAVPGENLAWQFEDGILKVTYRTSSPINENRSFKMYPNPVDDRMKVSFSREFEKVDLSVFSLTGNLMVSSVVSGTEAELDLGRLNSGFYLIKVVADGLELERQKIIKR